MATITSLPDEVIDIILKNKSISIVDIVNFMSTCKKFRKTTQSDKFWEIKFYQRSPTANKKYNNNYNIEKRKKISENVDFKKEIEAGIKCINELRYYHSLMCINNLWKSKAIKLNNLLRSTAYKPMIYYFVIDDLYRMLSQLSGHPDLISTYHLGIIFRYLKQHRLTYKLNKYNRKPIQKQLLEEQLIIIAQYFQPHVSYSAIKMWLDDIKKEVLLCLQKQYPTHSIFSISFEQFFFWRDNNIEDNFWDQTEANQIMHILEFLFAKLENHKLHQFWKILNPEDKYISENIQKYVLLITYHIVARRLGIRCDLVSYYGSDHKIYVHLLRIPKYHAGNNILISRSHFDEKMRFNVIRNLDNVEYLYVNEEFHLPYPLNIVKEKVLRFDEIKAMEYFRWRNKKSWDEIIKNTTLKMTKLFYQWQMRNKSDYSWEYNIILDKLMHPKQTPNIADFLVESHQVSDNTYFLTRSKRKRRKIIKKRNDEMRFAVGMIVTHSSQIIVRNESFDERYNGYALNYINNYINNEYRLTNNHDGVIVGWNNLHMYNDTGCPHLRNNPCNDRCQCRCTQRREMTSLHYKILSENNIFCYVLEDNISICPPKKINNIEIGRFFSKFEGTHYVLNEWLAEAYPEDTAALSRLLLNQ